VRLQNLERAERSLNLFPNFFVSEGIKMSPNLTLNLPFSPNGGYAKLEKTIFLRHFKILEYTRTKHSSSFGVEVIE